MRKIELFGLSLTFKINKKNADDAELYTKDHHLKEKIFYLFMPQIQSVSKKGETQYWERNRETITNI